MSYKKLFEGLDDGDAFHKIQKSKKVLFENIEEPVRAKKQFENINEITLHMLSTKNMSLLEEFALKKLSSDYSSVKRELESAIQSALQSCIENVLESNAVESWTLNQTNVANLNIQIWKLLKHKVQESMKGIVVDTDEIYESIKEHVPYNREERADFVFEESKMKNSFFEDQI